MRPAGQQRGQRPPGSASAAAGGTCTGYRREEGEWCGFVELETGLCPEPREFKGMLEAVESVDVVLPEETSMAEQLGENGSRHMEHNLMVHTRASMVLEFRTIRRPRPRMPGMPVCLATDILTGRPAGPADTLTVSFKDEGKGRLPEFLEGWRILRAVCRDKALDPQAVDRQYNDAMARAGGDEWSVANGEVPGLATVTVSKMSGEVIGQALLHRDASVGQLKRQLLQGAGVELSSFQGKAFIVGLAVYPCGDDYTKLTEALKSKTMFTLIDVSGGVGATGVPGSAEKKRRRT